MSDRMNDIDFVSDLARKYALQHDWQNALEMYKRELELNPDSPCIFRMAEIYETIGDYTNAELYQIKAAGPLGSQMELANFYYRNQRYDKALPIFVDCAKTNMPNLDGVIEQSIPEMLSFVYDLIKEDYEKILRCYDELGIYNDPFKEEIRKKLEEHTKTYRKKAVEYMSQSNPFIKQIVDEDGFLDDTNVD